ncbi:MAG: AAA family ATPase [Candidatus Marinimicrobia bacterium]|jgi:DNA polymerase III delta prime subunit|nr:AAA family ATPase [Candidatus Neomarinimicrobiota bacterium]MDP6249755.1 AAA family ATPase [Candidatus Paceibacterota bacterium]|tara:strand:+ start:955 stop:1890 length:936 start_codon:yes stop_codon:yes gene_type:complete
MAESFLWVESYRPKSINDCILPDSIKNTFLEFIGQKEIPNLLLSGGSGVGKTTVARALCEQLKSDYIIINGSEESGIDVLRNKIKTFASTVSLQGGKKVVILDEADYLNPQSTQPALRGFIEEFHNNCRFIFTCNFKNRIIEPLHSRCAVIEFKINGNKAHLAAQFMGRVEKILKTENIGFEEPVVAELIMKHFPDFRRVLNELQRYSVSGTIDSGILVNIAEVNMKSLMEYLKNKEFGNVRKWVVDNIDNDPVKIFRKVYEKLYEYMEPSSIPAAVLVIGKYQYYSAFVADPEVNLLACLTEIMTQCQFK